MRFRALSRVSVYVSLLVCLGLTTFGLTQQQWPDVLPWVGEGTIFNYVFFMSGCAALVAFGSCWSKRNPLLVGIIIATLLALLSGTIWPLFVTLWFAFASTILGKWILSILRLNFGDNYIANFLVGAGTYGTTIGLLAHFPVNYPGVYGVALTIPILLGWRSAQEYLRSLMALLSKIENTSFVNKWLDVTISVVALVFFVVALMPEMGHDALAMHLFIPAHMASRHQWGFDPGTYVWAVMPTLGDWIFSLGYMLAGETAARLFNIGFILVLGWLVRDMVIWAGGSVYGARWATILYLSTPLTFTEGSLLFIESVWATFVVAGLLALLRLSEVPSKAKSYLILAALFLGYASATKAVTLSILPVLLFVVIWQYKILYKHTSFTSYLKGAALFLSIGLIPYLTAWHLTGNPVFPFFNGIFKSPYYPPVNFDSAVTFGKGVTWDLLYRGTFESGRYLEATMGASGFQWLLLLFPAAMFFLVVRERRGTSLMLIGVLIVVAVFQSVSYFRYVFPALAILAAAIGLALDKNTSFPSKTPQIIWFACAILAVLLNLTFLSAGAAHRDFPIQSIWSDRDRDIYLQSRLPIRRAVSLVNQINVHRSPVAVFAEPLTGGMVSDALYFNWYNTSFYNEINAANTVENAANLLLRRGVDFVILDSQWAGSSEKRGLLVKATELIAEYGSVSVRKVRTDYRYKTELLRNPNFDLIDGWSLAPGAVYDPKAQVINVDTSASATQAVPVSPGKTYLNKVVARCLNDPALGRVQVNWMDTQGQFIKADIKTFQCMTAWDEQVLEVTAPPFASAAIVYVTGHTKSPLQFKSNSFRQ